MFLDDSSAILRLPSHQEGEVNQVFVFDGKIDFLYNSNA